jgi:lipopolysaccharide transport system ATP-binding protein
MPRPTIEIQGIGKRYYLSHSARPDTLKAYLKSVVGRRSTEVGAEEFWALRDITLTIGEGQCLALVGKNGSGKSTLLKILSRVIPPTTGTIRVRGRVASLLEVGTGFHIELTGRENIFLNGAMLGCREQDIRRRFDSIVDFSGVERFLDTPVKHYSSGMYVRLAYAVAAHVDANILIIDEVLAVGDADFQQKCRAHLAAQFASGKSGIIVSHDTTMVRALASRVAWIQAGHLADVDDVNSGIIERYVADHSS